MYRTLTLFSGKILDALDLPVHAESWLRHGSKIDKKDREMHVMFQNIRVKRLYGPLTQGTKVGNLLRYQIRMFVTLILVRVHSLVISGYILKEDGFIL